jgi:hypothetical protein
MVCGIATRAQEDSVRLQRLANASGRPLDFTVRRLNVPRYEVTVQGRGILVPVDTSLAVSFLRIVQVSAADPLEAEVRAVDLVASEWSSSLYASTNRGSTPYLTIMRTGVLSWWHRFLGAPSGYMFFAEDGVLMPSNNR